MRRLPLVIIAMLFFACSGEKARVEESDSFFQDELFTTYKIEEVNSRLVGAKDLQLAPGVWHEAMRFLAWTNSFERVDYCLLVKTPDGVAPGEMKFARAVSAEQSCSELFFSEAVSATKEFYNLFIDLSEDGLVIRYDSRAASYQLPNLAAKSLEISVESEYSFVDEERLADGEVCYSVADDCSVSEDRCGMCSGGSYPVKNSACPQAYSKVCGEDRCGEKGRPACIRGHASSGVVDYCIQGSPVGFCSGDNVVGCVNGLLVCE